MHSHHLDNTKKQLNEQRHLRLMTMNLSVANSCESQLFELKHLNSPGEYEWWSQEIIKRAQGDELTTKKFLHPSHTCKDLVIFLSKQQVDTLALLDYTVEMKVNKFFGTVNLVHNSKLWNLKQTTTLANKRAEGLTWQDMVGCCRASLQ